MRVILRIKNLVLNNLAVIGTTSIVLSTICLVSCLYGPKVVCDIFFGMIVIFFICFIGYSSILIKVEGVVTIEIHSWVVFIYNFLLLFIGQNEVGYNIYNYIMIISFGVGLFVTLVWDGKTVKCNDLEKNKKLTGEWLDKVFTKHHVKKIASFVFTYINKIVVIYLYIAGIILLLCEDGWVVFAAMIFQVITYYKCIELLCSRSPVLRQLAKNADFCCAMSRAFQAVGASAIAVTASNGDLHRRETELLKETIKRSTSEDMAKNLEATSNAFRSSNNEQYRLKNTVEQIRNTIKSFKN